MLGILIAVVFMALYVCWQCDGLISFSGALLMSLVVVLLILVINGERRIDLVGYVDGPKIIFGTVIVALIMARGILKKDE